MINLMLLKTTNKLYKTCFVLFTIHFIQENIYLNLLEALLVKLFKKKKKIKPISLRETTLNYKFSLHII